MTANWRMLFDVCVQLSHHQSILSSEHRVSLLYRTGHTPQRYWTQCQTFISIQTPDNIWSYVAGKLYGQANPSDPFILICCQMSVLLIWQKRVYLESVELSANEPCVCVCVCYVLLIHSLEMEVVTLRLWPALWQCRWQEIKHNQKCQQKIVYFTKIKEK